MVLCLAQDSDDCPCKCDEAESKGEKNEWRHLGRVLRCRVELSTFRLEILSNLIGKLRFSLPCCFNLQSFTHVVASNRLVGGTGQALSDTKPMPECHTSFRSPRAVVNRGFPHLGCAGQARMYLPNNRSALMITSVSVSLTATRSDGDNASAWCLSRLR